jgi:KDZ transposase-like protein
MSLPWTCAQKWCWRFTERREVIMAVFIGYPTLTFICRFINVDYVVLSSAKGIRVVRIVLTFDVNCQYSKKFWERMKNFPIEMQLDENTVVEFAIPSWHINAHGADCRADFGLSFQDGVGRTCGEEVEVTWAGTNPLGPSTREMGPGARHETLNGQWGGLNFRRILNFRKFFFFFFFF